MKLFSKIDHHYDLMSRMADTVQADIGAALVSETVTGQELRNAVIACTGCEGGEECPDWLASHTEGAADTPQYCRNRDLMLRLRG